MTQQYDNMFRPATRTARLNAIEQALRAHVITSQAQLAAILAQQGIDVTQATLSRDLDEIHAAKSRLADGTMAYMLPDHDPNMHPEDLVDEKEEQHMARVLSGLVTSVARANNLIVIHTSSGAAQYVASVIDRQITQEVLGTIAGDDTVLVICATDAIAQEKTDWLVNID
ncbi:arginine repressor [Bifidobacterium magnum]|uniref:Arginine repressor n=1 Tax=Bifidobacterium magnum TaxID=1692 RepID=A0A087B965_9BIFI|nr:arginine repressor [Bifidobacterium magnum]KFI67565.1 Arginine repressor [Bifidobacterium magnum]